MDFLNLQDSSDDEDIINYIEHLGRDRRPKLIRDRPDNFHIWDDHDFFVRYRLSKNTVRHLIDEINEFIVYPTNWNSALTAEQMVLLSLRFYATGSFLSTVGDLTGVHKSTASSVVRKVSHAIASMRQRYIYLPTTNEVNQGFYNISNFPRVIGAIDCTHIKIQSPGGEEAEIYRNRKGYFSLNVQTICDHNLKIRNMVCRWPGSTDDSHIFNNSYVREQFERRELGNNYLLLGDSGYRNRNYLLTPLLNPVTRAEQLYESHIRTRNCVERQYGVWKRRFPVLSTGIRLKLRSVESIVVATAILHNIACDANEDIPPVDDEVEAAININVDDLHGIENIHNLAQDNRPRHHLITNYFNNLAYQ